MNIFEEMFQQSEKTDLQKRMIDILFDPKDADMKTELDKPLRWAALETIEEFLRNKHLYYSADIIKKFNHESYRKLFSHKRKVREEGVQALQALTNSLSSEIPISQTNQKNNRFRLGG